MTKWRCPGCLALNGLYKQHFVPRMQLEETKRKRPSKRWRVNGRRRSRDHGRPRKTIVKVHVYGVVSCLHGNCSIFMKNAKKLIGIRAFRNRVIYDLTTRTVHSCRQSYDYKCVIISVIVLRSGDTWTQLSFFIQSLFIWLFEIT